MLLDLSRSVRHDFGSQSVQRSEIVSGDVFGRPRFGTILTRSWSNSRRMGGAHVDDIHENNPPTPAQEPQPSKRPTRRRRQYQSNEKQKTPSPATSVCTRNVPSAHRPLPQKEWQKPPPSLLLRLPGLLISDNFRHRKKLQSRTGISLPCTWSKSIPSLREWATNFGGIAIGVFQSRVENIPRHISTALHLLELRTISRRRVQTRPPIRHQAVCIPSESRHLRTAVAVPPASLTLLPSQTVTTTTNDDNNDNTIDGSESSPLTVFLRRRWRARSFRVRCCCCWACCMWRQSSIARKTVRSIQSISRQLPNACYANKRRFTLLSGCAAPQFGHLAMEPVSLLQCLLLSYSSCCPLGAHNTLTIALFFRNKPISFRQKTT